MRRALLVCLVLVAGAQVHADGDAKRAREALLEGRILPLTHFMKWIELRYVGQLIEAELEEEDGALVYELEWLTPAGHVVEWEVDAATGRLLETEGNGLDEARREPPLPEP